VAEALKEDMLAEYAELEEIIGDFFVEHNITLARFLQAHKVILSRSTYFFQADGSCRMLLAPGQDYFNHSVDAPIGSDDVNLETSERNGVESVVVRACQDYAIGDQAFWSYSSNASNGRLLLMGGFVVADNPCDGVELTFTFPVDRGSQPLFEALARSLRSGVDKPGSASVEETKDEFVQTLPPGDPLPTEMSLHMKLTMTDLEGQLERTMAFLRLDDMIRSGQPLSAQVLVIGDINDAIQQRTWQKLKRSLETMQAGYERGLEQDMEELKAAKVGSRREKALQVLVGEKKIFRRALEVIVEKLQLQAHNCNVDYIA